MESTVEHLRLLFARISGLPSRRIEAYEPLENYGIDSLMIVRLNRELGDLFGALSKTLFYEYRTLSALAGHLVDQPRAHASAHGGLVRPGTSFSSVGWSSRAPSRASISASR